MVVGVFYVFQVLEFVEVDIVYEDYYIVFVCVMQGGDFVEFGDLVVIIYQYDLCVDGDEVFDYIDYGIEVGYYVGIVDQFCVVYCQVGMVVGFGIDVDDYVFFLFSVCLVVCVWLMLGCCWLIV